METINVTQKPSSILIAVNLFWASWAAGLANVLLDFSNLNVLAPAATIYFTLIFTFIILALLTWKISAGKNWARIVFLVMFLIGLIPSLPIMLSEFYRFPLVGALSLATTCLQGYALFLTFTNPGNIWFSKGRSV